MVFLEVKKQKKPFLMFSHQLICNNIVLVTKIVITFYLEIGLTRNWWLRKVDSITYDWISYVSTKLLYSKRYGRFNFTQVESYIQT